MTTIKDTKSRAQELASINTQEKNLVSSSKNFTQLLEAMKTQIQRALPRHLTVERMMRVAQTAYSSNTKLRECDHMTIIAGVVQSAQMGLELNTSLGHAYLVPYFNGKTKRMEAQFQTGYKGELSLAYRTGLYRIIMAYEVYENDEFKYSLGLNQELQHVPAKRPEGKPIYYYAVYKTMTGGEAFYVMSREQIEEHAKKYSQAYKKGWTCPWQTDFDAMAKKTVLKRLLQYAPKSIEVERFMAMDGTVKKEIDSDMTLVPDVFDIESINTFEPEQPVTNEIPASPEPAKKESPINKPTKEVNEKLNYGEGPFKPSVK